MEVFHVRTRGVGPQTAFLETRICNSGDEIAEIPSGYVKIAIEDGHV